MPVETALGDTKGLRQDFDPHAVDALLGKVVDCRLNPLVAAKSSTRSDVPVLHRHLVLS